MSREPFISIVIPVRNEAAFMEQCIRSLHDLDYPKDRLEIIFADGRSTDHTREIALRMGCRVIDNPGRKISAGRNEGFAASSGQIVVFTDADVRIPGDWLRNAVRHFERTDAGGLSGPTPVPADQDVFGRAVGHLFELAGMAGGTVHFSGVPQAHFVEDLPGCNAFYRREALAMIMPSNTDLFSNEDVEMNAALRQRGVKLLMTPDVVLYHYKRSNPRRFWRQMYVFAIGRLQLGKRDRSFLKPSHWLMGLGVPSIVLTWLASAFLWPRLACAAAESATLALILAFVYYSLRVGVRMAAHLVCAGLVFCSAWPLGFMRELLFPVPRGFTSEKKPV